MQKTSSVKVNNDLRAITIAARNYLSRAIVLAKSYNKANPTLPPITILLVDAKPGEVADKKEYKIVTPRDLPIEESEFLRMAMIYNVTELCTAVKAWALEMLINEGAETAVYLDPDIVVYNSISKLQPLTAKHSIVLTPHTNHPIPRDGLRPTEADIMLAGVYNLGFIAVNKSAKDMLLWWQERKKRDCIIAPQNGVFVDQRWIDVVPGYFSHYVLRDPTYNVAYWNVHERKLTEKNNQIFVDGKPITFFHFSGYNESEPWSLSKYVKDKPRVLLSENEVLLKLCKDYKERLESEDTYDFRPRYRFNYLADGTELTENIRKIYRKALVNYESNNTEEPPEVFVNEDSAIINWFKLTINNNSRLNRFLYGLWEQREDLRIAYPDPLGQDTDRLIEWASYGEDHDTRNSSSLLPDEKIKKSDNYIEVNKKGINLLGYLSAELGVGEVARNVLEGIYTAHIPVNTFDSKKNLSRKHANYRQNNSNKSYPVTIASVNADQLPLLAHEIESSIGKAKYTIGIWAWETEKFPTYPQAVSLVDEIWALSDFSRDAIQKSTNKPVYTVPLAINNPGKHRTFNPCKLGIEDNKPYFLFVFDYLSVFARKNPLGVVDAFSKAFYENEGPILIIKSINGQHRRTERERLRLACSRRKDIHLIEDYIDKNMLDSLMGSAIAYVSLHRAEGYGLTISESMARGVPVIATAYSGNMQFMNKKNSLLVPYSLVKVGSGSLPYDENEIWADPDINVAAGHMRWIIENPKSANEMAKRARREILNLHSFDNLANFINERISSATQACLAKSDYTAIERSLENSQNDILAKAFTYFNLLPDLNTPSKMPLVKIYRKIIYRALAHHDLQEKKRIEAILEAMSNIDKRIKSIEALDARHSQNGVDKLEIVELAVKTLEKENKILKKKSSAALALQESLANDLNKVTVSQEEIIDHLNRVDRHSKESVNSLTIKLDELESEQIAKPYTSNKKALILSEPDGKKSLGYDKNSGLSNYAEFEDIFRGSEEFISNRLKAYLPYLSKKTPVVDLGCGRGELLDLLKSQHIRAFGIDSDQSMINRCKKKGLEVIRGDALIELERFKNSSLGAITLIEVVEHMAPDILGELFRLAESKLKPEGTLIIETVNPHSPAALKTFWLDITHSRPIYPESLIMLAKSAGFEAAKAIFPYGTGRLERDLRICGEYTIVAVKTALPVGSYSTKLPSAEAGLH